MGAKREGHRRAIGETGDINAILINRERLLDLIQQHLEEMDIVNRAGKKFAPLVTPDVGIKNEAAEFIRPKRQAFGKRDEEVFRIGFFRPAVGTSCLLGRTAGAMKKENERQRLAGLKILRRDEDNARLMPAK